MFLQVDAKALEWMCALHLSEDKVGKEEWDNLVDQHSVNQELFKLPSRLIAKTFLFRLIYGGTAQAYAQDPDFINVSKDAAFWQEIIDKTYQKYQGLHQWHERIVTQVMTTGELELQTGRKYYYQPMMKHGQKVWPRTQILNYPVQGLGAELMALARVLLFKRLQGEPKIIWRATVHDSIVFDIPASKQNYLANQIDIVWGIMPETYTKLYKYPWFLDMRYEITVGPDLKNLEVYL